MNIFFLSNSNSYICLKGNNMWNTLFLFSLDVTIKDFNKYSEKLWNCNIRISKEKEEFSYRQWKNSEGIFIFLICFFVAPSATQRTAGIFIFRKILLNTIEVPL